MEGCGLTITTLSETAIHPHLSLAKSPITSQRDHYHSYSLHGGPKLVQSLIQNHYWIPVARNSIRKRIFRWLLCCKLQAYE